MLSSASQQSILDKFIECFCNITWLQLLFVHNEKLCFVIMCNCQQEEDWCKVLTIVAKCESHSNYQCFADYAENATVKSGFSCQPQQNTV